MQEKRMQTFFTKERAKVLKGTPYVIPEFFNKEIGQGSFGSVRKIYDLSRRKLDLAVKIISKQDKKIKSQVIKEKQVIEKLPYCINLVNYQKFCLESQNNYYFIMEFCNGGTLFEILNSGKIFAEQEIIEFLTQFLNGYRQLLQHNIIHRDIKPQNILIHNGIYKICDFGLSKTFEKKDFSSDNEQIDFLQLSIRPGTPYFQSPEVLTEQYYNDKIDVFSLGMILFQMLFSIPNRILNEKQNKNQKMKKNKLKYPYFDFQTPEHFYGKLTNLQDNQNEAYYYLDELIKSSLINRTPEMVSLLKEMIQIDHSKRISFEQLFNHPLFKPELDKTRNDEYKYQIWNDIISDEKIIKNQEINNLTDQSIYSNNSNEKENNQIDLPNLEEFQSSNILNIEQIQQQLLEYKISICEEMQKNAKPLQKNNSYYLEKRTYYQEVLSSFLGQDLVINQTIEKAAGNGNQSQQIEQNLKEKNTIQSNFLEQNENNQIFANQLQTQLNIDENQSNIEEIIEIDLEEKNYPESFSHQLNQFIKESEFRIQDQQVIKNIEDILLFLRQVCFNYKKVASELSKSYSIIQTYNNPNRQADFIQHFDHVSLLSLIMFKYQLKNLKNNYNKILLDKNLFCDDNNALIDKKLSQNDEEVKIFNVSKESQLFIKQIKSDLQELQSEFNEYLLKEQFNTIYEAYQNVIDSHQGIKENYRAKISALIKQGIEEFGFLEQQQFSEFQKTLLYLTEIDLYEKNNRLYYQKYMFSRGNLLLRLEQIESSENSTQQLSQYCEMHGINLVAQTD